MNYFLSTVNFSPDSRDKLSKVVPWMVKEGYSDIEFSSLHPYEDNFHQLIEYAKEHNVHVLLHNFSPPSKDDLLINLSNPNDIIRKRVNAFIKERIDLTTEFGMDYYSFHAGFRVDYKTAIHQYSNVLSDQEAMDFFIDELRDILDYAEERKVHIGVENHVCIRENKDNLILYGDKNWRRLFEEISSTYLHLHLDLGHLKVTATEHGFNRDDFLRQFGGKVMAMHIHDNTGVKLDCHAPFNESFWFGEKQMKLLPHVKYGIFETKTYGDPLLIQQMMHYFQELEQS